MTTLVGEGYPKVFLIEIVNGVQAQLTSRGNFLSTHVVFHVVFHVC